VTLVEQQQNYATRNHTKQAAEAENSYPGIVAMKWGARDSQVAQTSTEARKSD
jgi:hypothetical protein